MFPHLNSRMRNCCLFYKSVFESAREFERNIYTEYKYGCPRFRYLPNPQSFIVLFPDQQLGLEPLQKTTISTSKHSQHVAYSLHRLDTIPAEALVSIPVPSLIPFFRGLCKNYCETKEAVYAIAAEQLADGMDLDEAWCREHMPGPDSKELAHAMALVKGRNSRIDSFSPNAVTCFIPNRVEAQRILPIPGWG